MGHFFICSKIPGSAPDSSWPHQLFDPVRRACMFARQGRIQDFPKEGGEGGGGVPRSGDVIHPQLLGNVGLGTRLGGGGGAGAGVVFGPPKILGSDQNFGLGGPISSGNFGPGK